MDLLPVRLQLSVVTPDREVVRETVLDVTVPGKNGYLGILPGHAPLLGELIPGELAYHHEGVQHYLAVTWGFAEVLPDRVIVLAQTAERVDEIDRERAQRACERAEERLKKFNDPSVDFERARAALARGLARLQVAGRV